MAKALLRNGLIVVLVSLGLVACDSAARFDYVPEADEMKPGSGLFSGKKGEFFILGSPETRSGEPKPEEKKPVAN